MRNEKNTSIWNSDTITWKKRCHLPATNMPSSCLRDGTFPTERRHVSFSMNTSHIAAALRMLCLTALMLTGNVEVWGQTDGYYFIANNNTNTFNATNSTTNWYMVPASDGGESDIAIDRWAWNDDPVTPFVTTFQTNKDNNSIWKFEKSGDYYYIIHDGTSKYLTYNTPMGSSSNRRAFHLQSNIDGDNSLFTITARNTNPVSYNITPKGLTTGQCYLNPSNGNKDKYYGYATQESNKYVGGLLGLYNNAGDNGSIWYFEKLIPTISYNSSNLIAITNPFVSSGTIYYTIDGTEPTTSSFKYEEPFDPAISVTTIKAIVVKGDYVSPVITYSLPVHISTTNEYPYLIQSVDNVAFYMIPGELDGDGNTTVNTTSLARPSMSWYFLNAGNVNGTQYYYVVNSESGDYLQRSGDNLYLRDASTFEAASDKTDYCFSIAEAASGYNIIARGLPNNAIYKGGNNPSNNQTNNVASKGTKTNTQSCWNLVSIPGNTMPAEFRPAAFTVSTDAATNYYKIGSVAAAGNFIIPPSGATGHDACARTSDTEIADNMSWFFKEAGSDDWLTYYYIINGVTGKYLYYNSTDPLGTGDQDYAFTTKDLTVGDDLYLFAVAKTTTSGAYYIVPKVLRNLTQSQYSALWRENANSVQKRTNRANDKIKWTFTPSTLKVAPPIITFDAANEKITIETTTKQSTVSLYYTTDGTDPTTSSTAYNASTGIQIGSGAFLYGPTDLVLKVIAVLNDGTTQTVSAVTTQSIDLTLERPTISRNDLTVTFSSSQTGVEFLYTTDSSDPKTNGTPGTSVTLNDGALNTIRVVAHTNVSETDYYSSVVVTEIFDLSKEQGTDLSSITYLQSNQTTSQYLYPNTSTTANGDPYVKSNTIKDEPAVWQLEKHDYYYYIRHYADADRRYLTAIPTVTDNAFFLSATASDDALFEVTETAAGSGIYLIKPKNSSDLYLKNNSDKNAQLAASTDNNAKWLLAKVPPAPTISVDDIRVSLASDLGTIYYTIDGSEPTTESAAYSGVIQLYYGPTYTIKAVSHYTDREDTDRPSDVAEQAVNVVLEAPTIDILGTTVTIYSSQTKKYPETVFIRYTMSGPGEVEPADPTPTTGTIYTGSFELATEGSYVIKAIIYTIVPEGEYGEGTYKTAVIRASSSVQPATEISDLAGLEAVASNLSGNYRLTANINVSGLTADLGSFTGTFDGSYHTLSGLTKPLFATVDGGTVKNVVLSGVSVSGSGNVGAICNEATGAAKIYNCGILSGTVSGSDNVGGLVGLIKSGSQVRVVNCYSYATVSGGTTMAGIVGKNEGTVGQVRIANCMMYGDMPGGTSPVYAGNHASNVKDFTEYNFYRSKADLSYTTYNDQLAIGNDEYLTRFPFYRHIQNTHRELAGYFLYDNYLHTDEIGHWVLNTAVAPYPIIEPWEENTTKVLSAQLPYATGQQLTGMGSSDSLSVSVTIGSNSYTATLPITDMDEANYDYTWGKVILPFANEFDGWTRDYSKVCTGWKITSITGGTEGTFANYNVADRDCTAKDLYDNSHYIFAQGGYYTVPYGVTAISIEAHFANAFYLSDASYEVGYSATYGDATAKGGNVPNAYHGQIVYTNLSTLVNNLATASNPHDQAIVLVGNYHYRVSAAGNVYLDPTKAVTIMSADEDHNQEPDYGWYMGNTYGRLEVPSLRFDFVPIIEMGMSSRVNGSNYYPSIGIWHARGWFELTETCVSQMYQCEINDYDFVNADDGKGNNRWIANSGIFTQIVRARDGDCTKLSYLQIGGNAYVKELYPGSHTDAAKTCTAAPIVVTGGEIEECYMTGYKAGGKVSGDMIRFWCTGGKMHKWLGAYLEEPLTAGLTAKIDHALFGRFFGGGTSSAARIKGDIDITINNSKVDFFCGGPEFGDMYSGKTLTTHATNTTFGVYYGAGFGGTSITYNREAQTNNREINAAEIEFPESFENYKRLEFKSGYGLGTCYKFEYIYHSNGHQLVSRFYTGYAQFSLATTGNVTNVLNNCTVKGDFYGAGCQGMVDGTVTSTLTNCTVGGSVFGGGYKAESNEVEVYTTSTQPTYSKYTRETSLFSDFGTVDPETFTWQQGTASKENTYEGTSLYTSKDIDMTTLGNVTGAIALTVDGGSVGGNIFGGGNESKSLNNTEVTIRNGATIAHDVFGGGNKADVSGSTTVNIED